MDHFNIHTLFTGLFLILFTNIQAQQINSNNGPNLKNWVEHHNMNGTQYNQKFSNLSNKGYRLTYVNGFNLNGTPRFNAIWEKRSTSGLRARHGMTAAEYQREYDSNKSNGYRLILVDGYVQNGQVRYAAIWNRGNTNGIRASHGLTSQEYQNMVTQNKRDGYILTHVSGYGWNGQAYYAAIWKRGNTSTQASRHGLTSTQYQQAYDEWTGKGFDIKLADSYKVGNQTLYAAIFEQTDIDHKGWHGMNPKNHQLRLEDQYYQGYVPVSVSGYDAGRKAGYTAVFKNVGGWKRRAQRIINQKVRAVMNEYNIPGASIAIVKNERLVFARGFGQADQENNTIASATTLYRIASMSKPLTGAAIMKLVEDNKLSLRDKVLGSGAILGTEYGSRPYGRREKAIELVHMLEHRAGGDAWDNNNDSQSGGVEDVWGSPMFESQFYQLKKKQLIGAILDDRNPSHQVNTRTAYSNFAYCLLGRVIAKKAPSRDYERYVKNKILSPCGITQMKIGSSTKSGREYREAVYNGGSGPDPYGLKMRRMDSHGGWIGSAVDLMRFAVRVDGKPLKKDILKARTVSTMLTSSYGGRYAKGWDVGGSTEIKHGGAMRGSRGQMIMMDNDIYFAYVTNKYQSGSNTPDSSLNTDMVNAIKEAIEEIRTWPNLDLF